jgi:helicase MOV-10
VYDTDRDKVALRFNKRFHALKGQKFDVQFVLNRMPFRRMHQALDAGKASLIPRLLFPKPEDINIMPLTTIQTIEAVNRDIGRNPPQMLAVTAIRNLRPGSGPFVVFGP